MRGLKIERITGVQGCLVAEVSELLVLTMLHRGESRWELAAQRSAIKSA